MSYKACPTEEDLLSFVDASLAPEQLARVEAHLSRCTGCSEQVQTLRSLIAGIAAPLVSDAGPLNTQAHVSAVMQRLDTPLSMPARPSRMLWGSALAGLGAVAAAALLVVQLTGQPELQEGVLTARGASSEASLSRDIGVQLYAREDGLRALGPGSRIRANVPLTAGLRNLSRERAYLLLFAIDARQTVHWIAPQFLDPSSDPSAATILPSQEERLLPSSVVFDDLAPGPLRIVMLITAEPTRVSQIETLSAAELSGERLMARFPQGEIRQATLEVTP